jgi:predicted nucleotidyltransferase
MLIVGIPALELRKLLREGDHLIDTHVERVLGISAQHAQETLVALEREGFLKEHDLTRYRADGKIVWELTTKGRALRIAKAGKPIKRSTADKLVAEFLQRVAQVNATRVYAYRVTRVIAFGSYLGDRPDLGDIDLGVEFTPKWSNEEGYKSLVRPRIEAAIKAGRHFGSYFDELAWPQKEIELFLKNRSRALSLTYVEFLPKEAETKLLYAWSAKECR